MKIGVMLGQKEKKKGGNEIKLYDQVRIDIRSIG